MENITTIIAHIEKKYDVRILHACETGSRAWGFPSPDSDYDIRFIYMHKIDWYLSLSERKDTIEFMLNEELDITGWDLKKSLALLKKSNAALIERFQSPIKYFSIPNFHNEFKKLITDYYSPTAVFFHHYSLAKKFWEDLKDTDSVKLKQYFYLIRSLLSCNWILKNNSVVPMHMEGLLEVIDDFRKEEIKKLIAKKATVGEKYRHKREESLHKWLMELWVMIEASKDKLGSNKMNYALLDSFLIKVLYENIDY